MKHEKVSKINFDLYNFHELEDFILKAAPFIKEGYHIEELQHNPMSTSWHDKSAYPILTLKLRKEFGM